MVLPLEQVTLTNMRYFFKKNNYFTSKKIGIQKKNALVQENSG